MELSTKEYQFLNNISFRKSVIAEIKADENKRRMSSSLQDCDIYAGRIRPYVIKYLGSRFTQNTVREMPIVASVNVTRKLVDQKASLYKQAPTRDFNGASEELKESISNIYSSIQFDSKMLESNRMFELQSRQNHVVVFPKNGKLKVRVLKNHQLNVVVSEDDPESGEIYLISSFDKNLSDLRAQNSNNENESIGDQDDFKSRLEKYIIWSKNLHFVMNGRGEIESEETVNPIAPICPIVEISPDSKDFEYWIEGLGSDRNFAFCGGGELSNFTVEYNGALSSLGQIVNMQGFAQAYLKAPEGLQPSCITVGPNYILRLITDPNGQGEVDFGFASPTADIASCQSYAQSLLSQFLSSQGLDPKTISGQAETSQTFSSGVERLLAMISQFEASKEVMSVYEYSEKEIFEVIKAWCNISNTADVGLDESYNVRIPENVTLSVTFEKPEAILTDDEKLTIMERKLDLGIISKVDMVMELENKTAEQAKEKLDRIEREEMPKMKEAPEKEDDILEEKEPVEE